MPVIETHRQYYSNYELNQAQERIYRVIEKGAGKVTAKDLYAIIGDFELTKRCITKLHSQNRIDRFRTFGDTGGVVYCYKALTDNQCSKSAVQAAKA